MDQKNIPFSMEDYQVVDNKGGSFEQIPSYIEDERPIDNNAVVNASLDNQSSVSVSSSLLSSQEEPNGNTDYDFSHIVPDGGFKSLKDAYSIIDLPDPFYMLCFFDPEINNGSVTLHPWQRDTLLDLTHCRNSKGENGPKATSTAAYKYCLLASNGSGKDKFIIAPWTVFFMITKIRARVIITTSSGVQLTGQTEPYIKDLCEKINKYFNAEVFKIRQRYIYCTVTGSECRMFATDTAGRAEGYHPIDATSEMCIIVNEGKSVTEDIHTALRRCTGYNYWLECSSAGQPKGYLHWAYSNFPNKRRITTYDCSHANIQDLEEDRIRDGESSAYFRSKHLSLFTSVDGQVVIPLELVESTLKLYRDIKTRPTYTFNDWPIRIGIDLAAGGDENAICICKGNKVIKEISFREKDTTITASRINSILSAENIRKDHFYIYADDGGVGHSIIDMLNKPAEDRGYGWNINRIMNQWAAVGSDKRFGNRGAQNWYRVARILEEKFFDLSGLSSKTLEQIYNRYYRQSNNNGKIYLQDKKEAKAQGFPSPDRADAFILSFTGLTVQDFLNDLPSKEEFIRARSMKRDGVTRFNTSQEVYEHYENNVTFKEFDDLEKAYSIRSSNKRLYNSLRSLIYNS